MNQSNPSNSPFQLSEIRGDMFALLNTAHYDAVCVTTNGKLRYNGNAIMGAGVAKTCREHIPQAEQWLGQRIRQNGNVAQIFALLGQKPVISFPTKFDWSDPSDLELIKRSCRQLMAIIDAQGLQRVLLPKPGCSNGKLDWSVVRAAITPLLDERVVIISK